MAFAHQVVKMTPDLIKTGMGRPALPEDGAPPALHTFKSMQYGKHDGLFDFANFAEVYIYLRAGEGLDIPCQEWKDVLPKEMTAVVRQRAL